MRELLELDRGDVLITSTEIGGRVPITIEGRPKFHAIPGRKGGQVAVKLVQAIDEGVAQHAK
jgi:flagellar motor switch protein FliM